MNNELRKTMTKKQWKEYVKKFRGQNGFNTGTRDMGVETRAKRKVEERREIEAYQ